MFLLIKEFAGAACGVAIVLIIYYLVEFLSYVFDVSAGRKTPLSVGRN